MPITNKPHDAEIAYRGPIFTAWQWDQVMFDGSIQRFETLSRRDTVLVLPVTNDNKVLLALERQPNIPERLHAISGGIEQGESPEAAAHRELAEESGYTAERLVLWKAWQLSSKIDWAVYIFWAGGLSEPGETKLDPGEQIKIVSIPADDLLNFRGIENLQDLELTFQLGRAAMFPNERVEMLNAFAEARNLDPISTG